MRTGMEGSTMRKLSAAVAIVLLSAALPHRGIAHDMSAMSNGSGAAAAMGAHAHMSEHMKLTDPRPSSSRDEARARELLARLRRALGPYRDYRVALAEGFRIFLPTVPQDVYHFTDFKASGEEYRGHFDPDHPGSLLYVKRGEDDYVLVGAMYSAPPYYTPDELDGIIPLSVARWHQHVNICLPREITLLDLLQGKIGAGRTDLPGTIPVAVNPAALDLDDRLGFMADGRFGFEGRIHDRDACEAAGGSFLPLAFGWMVHVYPFSGDDLKVAYGMKVPPPPATGS
jgi:hypothetical protein